MSDEDAPVGGDVKCCGVVVGTAFCPECGKRLRHIGTPQALLTHLRSRIALLQSNLRNINPTDPRCERMRKQYTSALQKWQCWETWVSSALVWADSGDGSTLNRTRI